MFFSEATGVLLFRAQALAIVCAGVLLRRLWQSDRTPLPAKTSEAAKESPIRGAVLGLLNVCGYMVFFSVLSALLARVVPALGAFLLPFLEIAGGCALLSRACLPMRALLPLVSFFCGLGGLSVGLQNLALVGVPPLRYIFGKILQGALGAFFCRVLLDAGSARPQGLASALRAPIAFGCLTGVIIFLFTLWKTRVKHHKNHLSTGGKRSI